jgi:hypothetical protein
MKKVEKSSSAGTNDDSSTKAQNNQFGQPIAKPSVSSGLSDKYKLMIYFAHSTMVMYSTDIVCHYHMTVSEFREQNEDVCKRVFDEGLSIMNYELSNEQMMRACYVYLKSKYMPRSVKNSEVYKSS